MSLRRLSTVVAALLIGLTATGCATHSAADVHHAGGILSGTEVADSNNDGAYIEARNITYQLQISRQLNPFSVQDRQFLVGLPSGMTPTGLAPNELWYGVFLWAKNQHHAPHWTSDRFEIVDTQGNTYHPIKLDTAINPLAWKSQQLQYGDTEPGEDQIATQFFEGGKLVLFKLNDSIYSNRPLTLYILSPQNKKIGSISLDL